MALIVYGGHVSPFVRKVLVALREKGLEFHNEPINPFMPPDNYCDLNPLGRIPAFRDDDQVLADSGIIMAYIERRFPETPLLPADPYLAARALWFEKYADYELAAHCTAAVFRNRVIMRMLRREVNEADIQRGLDNLPPYLDYLERELGEQEYMVANQFSLADIAIASQFANFELARERIDATRWPRLAAYVQRLHSRPSFQECLAKDRRFIEKIFGADYFSST